MKENKLELTDKWIKHIVDKLHKQYCLYIPDCVAVTYPIKCKDIIKDLMYYKDLKHEIQSLTKCFYNPTLRHKCDN